eukprot:535050-Amphidinium_carterae.2
MSEAATAHARDLGTILYYASIIIIIINNIHHHCRRHHHHDHSDKGALEILYHFNAPSKEACTGASMPMVRLAL